MLQRIWIITLFYYEGLHGGFIAGCRENIIQIRGDTLEETRLEGVFQVSET